MTDNRRGVGRCPVCRTPAEPTYHPFCSKRCADVDLNRWLKGNYAIAGAETDDTPETSDGDHDQVASGTNRRPS